MELPTEWILLNSEPISSFGLSSVVIGDTAYVIGGNECGSDKPQTLLRIRALNIKSGEWDNLVVNANNALNRSYHASTVLGGKIYTFGGVSATAEFGTVLEEYIVNAVTSEGMKCLPKHEPTAGRKGLTASTIGLPDTMEKIVLFGGSCADGSANSDVVVFSEAAGDDGPLFQTIPVDGPTPLTRMYHSACVTGRRRDLLVVHGGRSLDSQDLLGDMWVLDASALLQATDSTPPPESAIKGKGKTTAKGSPSMSTPVWSAVSLQSPIARCLHSSAARCSDNGFILWTFGGVGEAGPLSMDTLEMEISCNGGNYTEESSGLVGRGFEGASSMSRYGFTSALVLENSEPAVICVFGGVQSSHAAGNFQAQSDLLLLDPSSEVAMALIVSLPSCHSTISLAAQDQSLTVEYSNGDVYYGEVLRDEAGEPVSGKGDNFSPHGAGKMSYANGSSYEGLWSEGTRQGKGVHMYDHGDSQYEGDFERDMYHGQGRLVSSFDFHDGNQVHRNRVEYSGTFKERSYHGHGVLADDLSDTTYEGEFQTGQRVGHGILKRTSDGVVLYDGDWADNQPGGYGTIVLEGGHVYTGQIAKGLPEGKGLCKYADGGEYEGTWRSGKRNGFGEYVAASLDEYRGKWVGDARSGRGVWQSKRGDKYEGLWDANMPHRQGVMTYNVGSACKDNSREVEYSGGWNHGKRNGLGQVTYADGSVKKGSWKSDNFDDALSGYNPDT